MDVLRYRRSGLAGERREDAYSLELLRAVETQEVDVPVGEEIVTYKPTAR